MMLPRYKNSSTDSISESNLDKRNCSGVINKQDLCKSNINYVLSGLDGNV